MFDNIDAEISDLKKMADVDVKKYVDMYVSRLNGIKAMIIDDVVTTDEYTATLEKFNKLDKVTNAIMILILDIIYYNVYKAEKLIDIRNKLHLVYEKYITESVIATLDV